MNEDYIRANCSVSIAEFEAQIAHLDGKIESALFRIKILEDHVKILTSSK
jgi:hypothetical protein